MFVRLENIFKALKLISHHFKCHFKRHCTIHLPLKILYKKTNIILHLSLQKNDTNSDSVCKCKYDVFSALDLLAI